jgi:hypothetical protein
MKKHHFQQNQYHWQDLLSILTLETASLAATDRAWVSAGLRRIAALQERLHALFVQAGGPGICSACQGHCCDCGKNHLTLVNLLGFLIEHRSPPEPDYAGPCPFLGPDGCMLRPPDRPFNCVTFLCEEIESRLESEEKDLFYALEKELRTAYEEFDSRFAGSTLRGIFIRAERLNGRPFLGRPSAAER